MQIFALVSQLSIRQRFFVIVATTMVGFGVIGAASNHAKGELQHSAGAARLYSTLAIEAEQVSGLALDLRLIERTFLAVGDRDEVKKIERTTDVIIKMLETMGEETSALPELQGRIESARSRINLYTARFNVVGNSYTQIEKQKAFVHSAETAIQGALIAVRRDVEAGTGITPEAQTRLRAGKLDELDKLAAAVRETGDRITTGEGRLMSFDRTVKLFLDGAKATEDLPPAMLASIVKGGEIYHDAVAKIFALREQLKDDVGNLDEIYKEFRLEVASVSSDAQEEMAKAGGALSDALQSTAAMVFLIIAVTLAAVSILAVLVGGATTALVRRLTDATDRLASGDQSVAIPFVWRRDEVGAMAKALVVFKDNARALAEAEAEKVRRAESSRLERRAMLSELTDEIGAVVEAAAAGDFSRMVTKTFAVDEFNAIGASLNRLVATVDQGLSETVEVLAALGRGDVDARVEGEYAGAFHELKEGVNGMAASLADVIQRIAVAAAGLRAATTEIMSGADDLSDRTTQQAATIEQTSAALEEFSSTVKANAARAREAAGLAYEAQTRAEDGGKVMADTENAILGIDRSSAKIGEVIGLIDDIAFQTNLLALNASVEAARAGEAGRGFAVVATEVRRLAQRAAEASSEVKALVTTAQGEVRAGVRLVEKAAAALNAILASARDVTGLMRGIAEASSQQAESVAELASAVRRLDEMTQANAALVEETNNAIAETTTQAQGLQDTVDGFRLASDGDGFREAA